MTNFARRDFLKGLAATGVAAAGSVGWNRSARAAAVESGMKFGLVTYLWGADMDLPTLLEVCESAEVFGVELRTQHAHGVEPELSQAERAEVRKRFADSPVTLVGYGSNAEYHSPDPEVVQQNIELTKRYVQLMHDCGGSGVKVKPNALLKDVPHEKTIEQIGKSLNIVGEYAEGFGQEIRVEAHGFGTSELPVMKAIFDVADHHNVGVCWNCNKVDLEGGGLEHNFNLVKDRFGSTVHAHEFDSTAHVYPYEQFLSMLAAQDYDGWILLEAVSKQEDKAEALAHQRALFDELVGRVSASR